MSPYVNDDNIPVPSGVASNSREVSGGQRDYEWHKMMDDATGKLGFDPRTKMRRQAIGGAIAGLGTLASLGAGSLPAAALLAGASNGVGSTVSTGSPVEGVKDGVGTAAATFVGGKLFQMFPKAMTIASGAMTTPSLYNAAEGAIDSYKSGTKMDAMQSDSMKRIGSMDKTDRDRAIEYFRNDNSMSDEARKWALEMLAAGG
jgi:hypothetical protein